MIEVAEIQEGDSSSLHLLCVEDSDSDYIYLRENLFDLDFNTPVQISRASRLAELIELLQNAPDQYDAVFLDLSLPDAVGMESFQSLNEIAPDLPVVILSGSRDESLVVNLIKAGAQDYLSKDELTPGTLMRTLSFAMLRQQARFEKERLSRELMLASKEVNDLQMQLIQSEKLESLGRLAAGVAHEVRNPLGSIRMGVAYLRSIEEELNHEGVRMIAEEIETAVERADDIVQSMLDLSREEKLSLVPTHPNEIIEESLRLCQPQWDAHHITLQCDLAPDLPQINADPGKLEQVLLNIYINAIHAMESSPVKELHVSSRLTTHQTDDRNEGSRQLERLRNHDEVVVFEVRDTGPGIPSDRIDQVFEPFFTTKATGKGTGLGLSVAKRILNLHAGHIEIRNEISPPGCCIRLYLKTIRGNMVDQA